MTLQRPRLVKAHLPTLQEDYGFIRALKKDISLGFAPIIVISGRPRVGKSMFGLTVCMDFARYLKFPFTIERNCFFDMPTFIDNFEKSKRTFFLWDEVQEKLNKTNFTSIENQFAETINSTQALTGNILVWILPAARRLATSHIPYVRYGIHVTKRRTARVMGYEYPWDDFTGREPIKKTVLDWRMRIPDVPKEIVKAYKEKEARDKAMIFAKKKEQYNEYLRSENPNMQDFIMPTGAN